jgi:hypothetical protein
MTKARTLADFISDGSPLADGTISVSEVSGAAPLANPTFTGGIDVTGTIDSTDYLTAKGLRIGLDNNNDIYAGNNPIRSTADSFYFKQTSTGEEFIRFEHPNVVVNEFGYDHDFRVESDNSAHALFVNAENSRVGMNESDPDNTLHVKQGDNNDSANNIYADVFSSGAMLKLENAWTGVVPAAQQTKIAGTRMTTVSNAGYTASGQIHVESKDFNNYDAGDLVFATGFNTSALMTERLRMNQGEAVFNDTGVNTDFRVESDNNFACFFVDAGNGRIGINQDVPGYTVDVVGGSNSNTDGIALRPLNESQTMIYSFLGMRNTYYSQFTVDSGNTGNGNYNFFQFFSGTEDVNGELLYLGNGGTVFNNGGHNRDFCVEADSNSNALFIDAGYNSGKGAAIVGSNSAPTTGVDYNIAASMLKYSDAQPIMATGAAWHFPSVPSNRQAQANRWRFQGFTVPYHSSDSYRADASYAQFVCELPNGGPSGKTDLELFEIGFNYGWSSGFYMVELYEAYYTNSGYKRYQFDGGYNPTFNLHQNYGNNSISLNVLSEGTFQDGTSSVPSTATDGSYYRKTVRASYGAYHGGTVVLTVPSWNELTLNNAEVDNGGKIRLLNPQ